MLKMTVFLSNEQGKNQPRSECKGQLIGLGPQRVCLCCRVILGTASRGASWPARETRLTRG